jgi:hypothetical protein
MNRLPHRHHSTMSKVVSVQRSSGWALTDLDGRVESVSRAVQKLWAGRRIARGYDFFRLFPDHEKVVRFDVTVALTGWPAARQIVVDMMTARPIAVRYLVSRRIVDGAGGAGLHWHMEFEEIDHAGD